LVEVIDLHSADLYQVMHDPDHGCVVLALLDAGMAFRDIMDALHCDGDVLTTMLLAFTRSLQRPGEKVSGSKLLSGDGQRMQICLPAQSSATAIRDREKLARHLRGDVLEWLMTFNLPATVRCDTIEHAASLLADTPMNSGEFFADRSIAEVLGLWTEDTSEEEFNILAARWLASWIRFWVSEPAIWTRALKLASADLKPGILPKSA
jgi:hypothetical protein